MLQLLQFCCCCQRQKGAGCARRFHTFNFCCQLDSSPELCCYKLLTIKQQICAKYWNRIDEILLILKGFQVDLFVWTSNMSPSHLRSTFYFTLKYRGRCVHLSPLPPAIWSRLLIPSNMTLCLVAGLPGKAAPGSADCLHLVLCTFKPGCLQGSWQMQNISICAENAHLFTLIPSNFKHQAMWHTMEKQNVFSAP